MTENDVKIIGVIEITKTQFREELVLDFQQQ